MTWKIKSPWTEARLNELKRLWGLGFSASEIAEELGDCSRNAVIGKAHRLGLEQRPSPIGGGSWLYSKKKSRTNRRAADRRKPPPPVKTYELDRPTPFKECQFPSGEPGTPEYRVCGDKPVIGRPYCEAHCRVAYRSSSTPGRKLVSVDQLVKDAA